MSLQLETLNKGTVEDFGYSYGGVHRVLLGELPPMPTSQYCELAGNALLQISTQVDEITWEKLGQKLRRAFYRDEQTKVDRESFLDLPEILPINGLPGEDVSAENLGLQLQNVVLSAELAQRLSDADPVERAQIFDSIIANLILQNGWTAELYQGNPFVVADDRVIIGGVYELSFLEFGGFVGQVLAGGIFGWDKEKGMPKAAKEVIRKLRQVWLFGS